MLISKYHFSLCWIGVRDWVGIDKLLWRSVYLIMEGYLEFVEDCVN